MDDILEINKNNKKFKVINDNDKFWIEYLENKWENSFFKNINSEHYKDKDFIDIVSADKILFNQLANRCQRQIKFVNRKFTS